VSFQTFTLVLFQVEVLCFVTPCSVVVHLHFTLKMEAAWTSRYPTTTLRDVTTQTTSTLKRVINSILEDIS